MRRNMVRSKALLFVFVLALSGTAFAGGGFDDPNCESLPAPTTGHFLKGEFSVALDKVTIPFTGFQHYQAHVVLKKGDQTHLFSFDTGLANVNICDVTADQLKASYATQPCTERVGEAFGLTGTPVIMDLTITKRDFCSANILDPKSMISGDIVVRVVPQ